MFLPFRHPALPLEAARSKNKVHVLGDSGIKVELRSKVTVFLDRTDLANWQDIARGCNFDLDVRVHSREQHKSQCSASIKGGEAERLYLREAQKRRGILRRLKRGSAA